MPPERWRRVEELYHAAHARAIDERATFLDEACAGDAELRQDVESLLDADASDLDFATGAAVAAVAPGLATTGHVAADASLSGRRIGAYLVQALVGAGAMGEVYRARDTKLGRDVAIKVLSSAFAGDPERLARFDREARILASLNHPNIAQIHGIEEGPTRAIVMELVDGDTLADKLAAAWRGGPQGLPLDEALSVSRQIAEALDAAHQKGIVHRDLKPANIKLTAGGIVKVLDFGIAKLEAGPGGRASGSQAPTITADGTHEGLIVGTAAYMSPEQARGQPIDKRSDIWAFGCVLYELLTGRAAFARDTISDTIVAILDREPDWSALPPATPEHVRELLRRCLVKDPARRLRDIGDARIELEAVAGSRPRDMRAVSARVNRRTVIRNLTLLAFAAAAVAGVIGLATRLLRPPPPADARTVKFTIIPNQLVRGGDADIDAEVSISRDGRYIAYVEADGGQLWVRALDQEQPRMVPGAKGVYQAFWSPDGQSIGYAAGRDLVTIPIQGGTPTRIAKLGGLFRRGWWSSDGRTIVYGDSTGLLTVPAAGGSPTRIVEHPHVEHPSFLDLPDGRRAVLYQAQDAPPNHGIYVQVLGETRRRLVTMSSSSNPYPAYSSSGHIIYVDGTGDSIAVWAVPFSLATLQPTGHAFPIAQRGSSPQVSATGTLVYSDVPSDRLQLVWTDRSGKVLSTIGDPQRQGAPTLSPDGRKLAVNVREGDPDIWIYDLDRGTRTRFTFDSAAEVLGSWTPSGDEFTYASNRGGNFDLFSKAPGGNAESRPLVETPADEGPTDWSHDQKALLYTVTSRETKADIFYRERRSDGRLGDAIPFVQTPFNEGFARFSPDGRFVAYMSDESGRNEVYVRDFPKGANKWLVSPNGGSAPRWRRDGRELFYVEQRRLMAAAVTLRPAFSSATPTPLFERRSVQFDASADGKRFVILDRLTKDPPLVIHVAHNWFEEFRSRARE